MTDEEFMVFLKDSTGRAITGEKFCLIAYSEPRYDLYREIAMIRRKDLLETLYETGADVAGKARSLLTGAFLIDHDTVEGMTIDGRTATAKIEKKSSRVEVNTGSRLGDFWKGYLHGYRDTGVKPARTNGKMRKAK